MVATSIGPWIEAGIILGYYTIFFGSNKIFKVAQHTVIGASLAYSFCVAWNRLVMTGINQIPTKPLLIIPIIIGLLTFSSLSERISWIARIPSSWLMAIGFGLYGGTTIDVDLIMQIENTMTALMVTDIAGKINGLVVFLGVIFVMIYFVYTIPQNRPMRWARTVARYLLMAALGAGAADFAVGSIAWMIEPISRVVYNLLELGL